MLLFKHSELFLGFTAAMRKDDMHAKYAEENSLSIGSQHMKMYVDEDLLKAKFKQGRSPNKIRSQWLLHRRKGLKL